jgi:hypothetical protein
VSQENVEVVREVFITRSGGDQEAGLIAIDPMAELDMSGVTGWAEKQVYRGADEVLPFLQRGPTFGGIGTMTSTRCATRERSRCSSQSTSGQLALRAG